MLDPELLVSKTCGDEGHWWWGGEESCTQAMRLAGQRGDRQTGGHIKRQRVKDLGRQKH